MGTLKAPKIISLVGNFQALMKRFCWCIHNAATAPIHFGISLTINFLVLPYNINWFSFKKNASMDFF